MKKIIILACLIYASVYAQKAHNQLLGQYESNTENSFYKTLSFDNNGKLNIDDFTTVDYFIIADTLIVFPDNDHIKFVMKGDEIYGASNWVNEGIWKKTNAQVIDQRKDPKKANEQAELLNEYYQKTKQYSNQFDMLFDKNLMKQYQVTLEALCEKNILRACKEYLGALTLEQMGGIEYVFGENSKKELKPNPAIEKIIEKVKTINKNEGIYLEASYLLMTGKTEKGNELMSFLASEGHQEALQMYTIQDKQSTTDEIANFSNSKPLKLEDLRLFKAIKTEDLKAILKSEYGFKKVDETISLDGGTITDFQNELFDKILKFEYLETQKNRIEYSTVNKEQINALIEELTLQKYTVTSKKTQNGESYTDYEKTITKNGIKQTLLVSIMYPKDKDLNEPITVMVF